MGTQAFTGRILALAHRHPRFALGTVVFLLLLGLNYPVLDQPPYWDSAMGPFAEAIWLKNNRFDYARLVREQPGFVQGGPAVYLWSVVPTVYAVALRVAPPELAFPGLRLMGFALAALGAVVLYGMLRELLGLGPAVSGCGVAILFCHPLYSGQVAAVNMEIPVSVLILLSANAMLRGRYWRACVFGTLGLLIKDAATIVCLTNLFFACLIVAGDRRHKSPAQLIGSCLVPLVLRFAVVHYLSGVSALWRPESHLGFLANRFYLGVQIRCCIPDIVALSVVTLGLSGMWLFRSLPRNWHQLRACPVRDAWTRLDGRVRAWLYGLSAWSMFAVFFVTCRLVVPRYVAWYLPLLLVAFLAALLLNRVSERQVQAALLVLLILCGVNAGGRAWAQLPESWQRSGELLERSREYLDDAEDCRRVARFLEYEGQGRPIIAIWPLVQMLTQPELGYVTRPLPVHAYDMFQLTYARTGRVGRLSEAQLKAALVVHSPNVFDTLAPWTLRPRDWDRILYRDRFGSDAIVVYQFGDRSDAPEQ